ncbi:signal peptide peptidase SppA [Polymorphobacter fuscus]|uniref:Signal peptide peptidase SppA n=1 Tax=Sandarakinorhabdus fusca TaxID=1439888 RepID=A0A7C9GPQ6_9SPHN|nr:signal peptide peptidase SppA [Polymorphobacter fuscus]KAB7648376.1 signal peptide peptidase SppA [Polymorphobacter fuscus]MQT15891.1 signal peptide peptidase SppA [Polymorphobacter fuscus]NJC07836.1 protease-4 [Polymorphobacter fuscus]
MAIVRGFWRVLVGVKDLLVLILLLLFFVGIWSLLNGRAPAQMPNGAALVLDMDGAIVDQAAEQSPFQALTGSDIGAQREVRDYIRAIDTAAGDNRIRALVLDLDTFVGAGQANLQSVGAALQRFRRTGKPINAYATAYTDDGYYLAAQAGKVWLNPLGGVLLTGPGGSNLYFKAALDKLDIDINVFRVGTYKAAVEPFTRTAASPEARAAEQALLDTLWQSWLGDVQAARPGTDVAAFIAQLPQRLGAAGGDQAKAALDAKLVDVIATRGAFNDAMVKLVGEGEQRRFGTYKGVTMDRYLASQASLLPSTGDAVGIVYVTGNIVDGEAPRGTAGATTIARAVARAVSDNDDIKALVVRIDSGGGSVLASEEIRQALIDAKKDGLPVVASFGPVAASGGYWVATAADEIYAQPSTITGSIGVFAIIPSFDRALERIGVAADGVKTTPYSGEPNVLGGIGPETRVVLQSGVEDVYRRFTTLVGAARKLPVAQVDSIGQGRVWAGSTAQQLKLVDHMGGLDAAVAAAARRAGLKNKPRTIDIERPGSPLGQLISAFVGPGEEQDQVARDPFAKIVAGSRMRLLAAIGDVRVIADGPTMQAACLECAGQGSPRPAAAARTGSWLARLALR